MFYFCDDIKEKNHQLRNKTDLRLPPLIWMYFYLLQMCCRYVLQLLALFSCYSWSSACKYYYFYHLNSYESFTWDMRLNYYRSN